MFAFIIEFLLLKDSWLFLSELKGSGVKLTGSPKTSVVWVVEKTTAKSKLGLFRGGLSSVCLCVSVLLTELKYE